MCAMWWRTREKSTQPPERHLKLHNVHINNTVFMFFFQTDSSDFRLKFHCLSRWWRRGRPRCVSAPTQTNSEVWPSSYGNYRLQSAATHSRKKNHLHRSSAGFVFVLGFVWEERCGGWVTNCEISGFQRGEDWDGAQLWKVCVCYSLFASVCFHFRLKFSRTSRSEGKCVNRIL